MGTSAPNGTNGTSQADEMTPAKMLPLALENLEGISKHIGNKTPVFFLDYDGTLCFIVPEPDNARMKPEMKAVLKELSMCYPSCIVTGRGLDKIKIFVELPNLTYAGSHGAQMEGPTIGKVTMGAEHKPALAELKNKLKDYVAGTPGAKLEDNSLSLSVHYRHVAEDKLQRLHSTVKKEVEAADLTLRDGKKVWEIRPKFDWHKGECVKYILEAIKMDDLTRYTPIFMGDDTTDEDAFKVLAPFDGIGVLVHDDSKPHADERFTAASYKVVNPDEVCEFLSFFAKSEQFRKNGGFGKGENGVKIGNNEGVTAATGGAGMAS